MQIDKLDFDGLRDRWRNLDDAIRSGWDSDMRTAQEPDINDKGPDWTWTETISKISGQRYEPRNNSETLLFLPFPFRPGAGKGAFPEMFAWDSYFVILGMLAYAGDDAAAQQALAPFRALATPYADFVKPGPYTAMYPPEDPDYHPTAVSRTLFMNRIGTAEAQQIVDTLNASDATFRVTQIRVLGGAIARVAPDATAYAHRTAPIMVNVAAFYTTEADRVKQDKWVTAYSAALRQEEQGAYVNFLADEPARIREAYPDAVWSKLQQVKAKYDPRNLFSRNQNIVPAT